MVPHGHRCDRIIVCVCRERDGFQKEVSRAKHIALFDFKLRIVPQNGGNGAQMAV